LIELFTGCVKTHKTWDLCSSCSPLKQSRITFRPFSLLLSLYGQTCVRSPKKGPNAIW
jgi:hypothetical protein